MNKRDNIRDNKVVEYELNEYHCDYYEWYIDDDYYLINGIDYPESYYLDEWFYEVDYRYLPDSKIIDMDSIYPIDVKREMKIDLILGLTEEKKKVYCGNTIADIIKSKNENEN